MHRSYLNVFLIGALYQFVHASNDTTPPLTWQYVENFAHYRQPSEQSTNAAVIIASMPSQYISNPETVDQGTLLALANIVATNGNAESVGSLRLQALQYLHGTSTKSNTKTAIGIGMCTAIASKLLGVSTEYSAAMGITALGTSYALLKPRPLATHTATELLDCSVCSWSVVLAAIARHGAQNMSKPINLTANDTASILIMGHIITAIRPAPFDIKEALTIQDLQVQKQRVCSIHSNTQDRPGSLKEMFSIWYAKWLLELREHAKNDPDAANILRQIAAFTSISPQRRVKLT